MVWNLIGAISVLSYGENESYINIDFADNDYHKNIEFKNENYSIGGLGLKGYILVKNCIP